MAFTNSVCMVNEHQMTARTRPDAPLRSNAALHRDAALARIGRARRWLIAGAAAVTGGLAAFVSATAHGHTLHKSTVLPTRTRATGTSSTRVQMPPLASPSSLGLQGPVQDPQSSSGGSSQAQSGSSSSNQPQSNPSPSPSQAAPAPSPAPSGGAVVSGGS
jgi:hypothetical protein